MVAQITERIDDIFNAPPYSVLVRKLKTFQVDIAIDRGLTEST